MGDVRQSGQSGESCWADRTQFSGSRAGPRPPTLPIHHTVPTQQPPAERFGTASHDHIPANISSHKPLSTDCPTNQNHPTCAVLLSSLHLTSPINVPLSVLTSFPSSLHPGQHTACVAPTTSETSYTAPHYAPTCNNCRPRVLPPPRPASAPEPPAPHEVSGHLTDPGKRMTRSEFEHTVHLHPRNRTQQFDHAFTLRTRPPRPCPRVSASTLCTHPTHERTPPSTVPAPDHQRRQAVRLAGEPPLHQRPDPPNTPDSRACPSCNPAHTGCAGGPAASSTAPIH